MALNYRLRPQDQKPQEESKQEAEAEAEADPKQTQIPRRKRPQAEGLKKKAKEAPAPEQNVEPGVPAKGGGAFQTAMPANSSPIFSQTMAMCPHRMV